jgi:hypothetical protein
MSWDILQKTSLSFRKCTALCDLVGFSEVTVTSFVSLLLPLMMLSRMRQRAPDTAYDPMAELKIGGVANWMLWKLLGLERALIRMGLSFPAGGSLLLVARKKKIVTK